MYMEKNNLKKNSIKGIIRMTSQPLCTDNAIAKVTCAINSVPMCICFMMGSLINEHILF